MPIAAPSDIVVMKVLSARPKDIEDVVAMLHAGPEGLDLDAVRDMLAELEVSPPAKLAPVSTEITGVRAPVGGGRDGARRARLAA